jgi:Na+-transporting NADH:ubiquinone oxidoreductase subunit B
MDVAPVATTTGATPLANLADHGQLSDVAEKADQVIAPMLQNISVSDAFFGFIPGSMGETSTAAILIGAVILLFTGVASWRIILSVFVGGLAFAFLFSSLGEGSPYHTDYPAYYHLLVGGFAFGAVFMATDPVTSAQTNTGKWIYGFMIGAMAICVRVMNPAYPEGMMLAILFMNALAPLIDYFVVERNIARRKKLIKNVK